MEILGKFIEFIKLPIKYVWVTFLACSFLLFAPNNFLIRLHIKNLSEQHQSTIGIIFIISFFIVLIQIIVLISDKFKKAAYKRKYLINTLKSLENLDKHECSVIREFYLQAKNTITLPIDQHTVVGLMQKGILEQVGQMGERSLAGILMSVRINPNIEDYINMERIGLPDNPDEHTKQNVINSRPDFIQGIERHKDIFHRRW